MFCCVCVCKSFVCGSYSVHVFDVYIGSGYALRCFSVCVCFCVSVRFLVCVCAYVCFVCVVCVCV